jgi:hypothetical protein
MSQEIESYFVRLGFNVEQSSLNKFNESLKSVGKTVSTTVGDSSKGIIGDLFKMQFALTSGMIAISAASINAITSFADFDKTMRLGAMGALMGKEAYTELNEALKMAGVTLAQASWDKESHDRVLENMQLIHKLNAALGPDAEKNAKAIRDFQNQFHQLGEELKYLQFAVGNDLFAKLFGNGDAQKALQKFNDWLLNNLPKIADEISTDLVPVFKDLWETTKDVGDVFKDAFAIFQEVTGVLSGDTSIQKTDVDFKSVATTVEHVVHWVDDLVKSILHLEEALLHLDFSHLTGGDLAHLGEAALLTKTGRGLALGGVKKVLGMGGEAAGAEAAGGVAGEAATGGGAAALGAVALPLTLGAGATFELWKNRDAVEAEGHNLVDGLPTIPELLQGKKTPSVHDRLKTNADNIAKLTGQKPELIYDQLAHETGNGTNRGYKDLHNLSGIEDGKGHYRKFDSDEDYDKAMARILARDLGPTPVDNIQDYAAKLKKGGYYEDSQANYQRGMQSFQGQYGAAPTTTATINNNIVVNPPQGADAHQVASIVMDKLNDQNSDSARFAAAAGTGNYR